MTTHDTHTATVAVTCPRGKTGSHVLTCLADAGVETRPLGRQEAARFDWADESTWAPALAGCSAAWLAYQPDLAMPEASPRLKSLAAVAAEVGVDHLVLLSGRGEEEALRAEQQVRDSGLQWTVVRASFFMQNFTEGLFLPGIMAGRVAIPTPDVPEPFVDVRDIAEVAVAAILDPRHRNRVHEVTGPEALTFTSALEAIGTATGRVLDLVEVTPAAFVTELIALGLPEDDAQGVCHVFTTVLDGRNCQPTPDVGEVLARPPRNHSDLVSESVARGVWDAAA